ncbi:hypothetical protein Sjap_013143 [Stephania japonica]|uniref:CHCH domain-containing protein n=1 Tax=Stephania japonica TaxID=461633 RepID=A0AAP0IZU0_9MAGN
MASSKHIATKCRSENLAFINCKKKDPNPEKSLEKGREVTRCVLHLLKDLHQRCTKEMDAYAGCMYYYTNEFDLCRKEQQEFEKACPFNEQPTMEHCSCSVSQEEFNFGNEFIVWFRFFLRKSIYASHGHVLVFLPGSCPCRFICANYFPRESLILIQLAIRNCAL